MNLSINTNNKNEIVVFGAVDPLIYVLKIVNHEARENASTTLLSLSVMEEKKISIGQSGVIQPLVDLLRDGTPQGKKDDDTALFNISIYHDNKARIVRAKSIKSLVEPMDPTGGMVDKVVVVLSNISTIVEGRYTIVEEGGIPALVEVVGIPALLQLCTHRIRFRAIIL